MQLDVICPYCQERAKLVDSSIIYGRSYGMIWLCKPCNAYVGTHKNSPDHKPLGRLADAELRRWKVRAHDAFDPIWRTGGMTRTDAYSLLAERLNIDKKDAHIGMFDVDMCKKVVDLFSS